jgi:DNA-binding MarR family transcriptional regulator
MPFDKFIIDKFIARGFIKQWRNEIDYRNPLYEMTRQGQAIVTWVYKRMNGEEEISMTSMSRDMMRKTNGKLSGYAIVIREMGKKRRKMSEAERRKTITPDL